MKNSMKSVVVIIVLVLITFNAFSQATATADAHATIVTAINISKTSDMDFGTIISGGTSGTVVLSAAGSRSKTGGVTLTTGGTVSAAAFDITGDGDLTYAITLPTSVTIESGANSMTVNTFTSNPSGTGTLSSGSGTLTVGATLNVGADQANGSYTTSEAFSVTVSYN